MATTMKDPHAGDPLDKDAIIRQQRLIIRDQRLELARHRMREHLIDHDEWGFLRWLLLRDIWPFSWWYHRFER